MNRLHTQLTIARARLRAAQLMLAASALGILKVVVEAAMALWKP